MDWQPSADFETLQLRAQLLDRMRAFFKTRNILEVETPLLCHYTVTDRYIESLSAEDGFLQTSPEYAMKRLLASGSGAIFQICKAFRKEEAGHQHNPEFSLLEWYHPGFNHIDLMDEMDELLIDVGKFKKAKRYTYRDLFKMHCDLDVFDCDDDTIKQQLNTIDTINFDRDSCLQLLLAEKIEPMLGINAPTFVYDFPASQAALAKIRKDNPPVAERFEVYIQGKEIANGFHELTDAKEQEQRFKTDQTYRKIYHKTVPDIDKRFIAALNAGLPECSGVALGIDRLLMCIANKKEIKEVISFG